MGSRENASLPPYLSLMVKNEVHCCLCSWKNNHMIYLIMPLSYCRSYSLRSRRDLSNAWIHFTNKDTKVQRRFDLFEVRKLSHERAGTRPLDLLSSSSADFPVHQPVSLLEIFQSTPKHLTIYPILK